MTNAITNFLPQLAAHPEIQDLMQTHFGPDAGAILKGMTDCSLGRDEAEELEALIIDFMADHADEVASFKGIGTTSSSSREAMADLQAHHPQAAVLIEAQAKELEVLLGKDQAAVVLGQKREPFYIKVLCWGDMYIVMADEFDNDLFNNKETAIAFAQGNYESFIQNANEHA